jgi:hypothetical protein
MIRRQTTAVLIVSPAGPWHQLYCRFADAVYGSPLALTATEAETLSLIQPARAFYAPTFDGYYTITLKLQVSAQGSLRPIAAGRVLTEQFPGFEPHAEDMPPMRGPVPMDLMCCWVLRMTRTCLLRARTVRTAPLPEQHHLLIAPISRRGARLPVLARRTLRSRQSSPGCPRRR